MKQLFIHLLISLCYMSLTSSHLQASFGENLKRNSHKRSYSEVCEKDQEKGAIPPNKKGKTLQGGDTVNSITNEAADSQDIESTPFALMPQEIIIKILSFTQASDYFSIRRVNHLFRALAEDTQAYADIFAIRKAYHAIKLPDSRHQDDLLDNALELMKYCKIIFNLQSAMVSFERKRTKQDKAAFRSHVFEDITTHPLIMRYCIERQNFAPCQIKLLFTHLKELPKFEIDNLRRIWNPIAFLCVLVGNKIKDIPHSSSSIDVLLASLRPEIIIKDIPFRILTPDGVRSILRYHQNDPEKLKRFADTFSAIRQFRSTAQLYIQRMRVIRKNEGFKTDLKDFKTSLKIGYICSKAHKVGKAIKYYEKAFVIKDAQNLKINAKHYKRTGLCYYWRNDIEERSVGEFCPNLGNKTIEYYEKALQMGAKLSAVHHANLAYSYCFSHKHREALEHYDIAFKMDKTLASEFHLHAAQLCGNMMSSEPCTMHLNS
jgi:tetratricopeptide (TPR) repeat protein